MTLRLGDRLIEAILFDYAGTLAAVSFPGESLDRAYENIARQLELVRPGQALSGVTLTAQVAQRVEKESQILRASQQLGEIDIVALYRRAYTELGCDLDDGTLDRLIATEQRAWSDGVSPIPGALVALATLHKTGVAIGLISNAPYRAASMHDQLERLGFEPYLDTAVFSGDVGVRKPHPKIFATALENLSVAPDNSVMVGDSLRDDIWGAKEIGCMTILVAPHDVDDPAVDFTISAVAQLPSLMTHIP